MPSNAEDWRREFVGCTGVISITAAVIGSIVVWIDEPNPIIWIFRIAFIILIVAGSVACYYSRSRADEVVDYLRQMSNGQHFDQDGFAFLPVVSNRNGVAYLEILFQNQRDCRCEGRVLMEPLPELFAGYRLSGIAFSIPCEAGVFGVARIPIPAPVKSQGEATTWNVGASVKYPDGKKGLLRFGYGLSVGHVADQSWDNAIMIAGLLTMMPILKTPARATLTIPKGVAEHVPAGLKSEIQVLNKPQRVEPPGV
jgi:hypothetical protein